MLAGGQTEAIWSKYLLPNDLGLPRALIAGGGGFGKTTMLEKVICPTHETFFDAYGSRKAVQQSRSALQSKNCSLAQWIQALGLPESGQHTHQK